MPLPDVDVDSYSAFTADRFSQRASDRVTGLQSSHDFLGKSNARIATLGYEPIEVASPTSPLVVGGPGVVLPPIRAPQLPQPAPAPAPAPPTVPPLQAPVPGPAAPPSPFPAPAISGGVSPRAPAPPTVEPTAPTAPTQFGAIPQ